MSYFKLDKSYTYKLNHMPRGRKNTTPIVNSCEIPYKALTIDLNSNCFICNCDGWLPIPVGKVQDFNSLEEVWNSPIAKVLQKDIDNKKFTWCAVNHCGIKSQTITKTKFEILINIDESCNLQCPSCRRDKIMHIDGPVVEQKINDIEHVMQWLKNFEQPIDIIMTGNGDPLASIIMRPLIKNFQPKNTQTFVLKTNGLLIKKQLQDTALLPLISKFSISVDAGSAETYQKVRLGGQWNILVENFEFLKANNLCSRVVLNFAIQKNNFRDLKNFVDCCLHYDFRGIVHPIDDWGTWTNDKFDTPDSWTIANGTFFDNQVTNSMHPDYNDCQKICQDIFDKKYKKINFSPFLLEQLKLQQ